MRQLMTTPTISFSACALRRRYIAGACVKAFRHKIEAELKGRMLEAGMSTDEIERVLAAGRAARSGC